MSCCINFWDFLSNKFLFYSKKFDLFLDEILEIKPKKKNEKVQKTKLNMEEIEKDEDHIIIDIPINKGYQLI